MWKKTWTLFQFGAVQKVPGVLGTAIYFAILGGLAGTLLSSRALFGKLVVNLIFIVALNDLGTLVSFISKESTNTSYFSGDVIAIHHPLHLRLPISHTTLLLNRIIHLFTNMLVMGLAFFFMFTTVAFRRGLAPNISQFTPFYLFWLSYSWLIGVLIQINGGVNGTAKKRQFTYSVPLLIFAILCSLALPTSVASWSLNLRALELVIPSLFMISLGVVLCIFRSKSL